jgi:transposase
MTSFSLVDKYTEKTEFLPRSVVKNSLIVANSLLISQGVNLNKAKDSVPIVTGKTTNKSSGDYKRLTRYFDQGKIETAEDRDSYNELMEYLRTLCWVVLFNQKKGGRRKFNLKNINYLLLDGTKWDFGEHHLHLLTLCIVIGDVAIPIWWEDLEKGGHSSQEERMEYLKKAMKSYKLEGMTLIADREYIGYEWFIWLNEQNIRFVIRVKEGIYHDEINEAKGLGWQQMKEKAQAKAKGKKVSKQFNLAGIELFYIILKNPRPEADDELIHLVSNWKSPTQAAHIYELRWQIEVCFKHLKSNGLNLEQMSVHGKEKRHLMMAVAVLVYILAIREGIIEESVLKNKVLFKKDVRTGFHYRAESVFKKGLSILMRKFSKWNYFLEYLRSIISKDFHYLFKNV